MKNTKKSVHWCSTCLTMSTRPRLSFDAQGRCNACVWNEKKKTLNWQLREQELIELLERHKSQRNNSPFNVLVPVSGGKDGSYVAHQLKHKYGMTPLTVTVTPALPLSLGDKNLRAFIESGYNHLSVNPSYQAMQKLNTMGFKSMGSPYYGWLTSILSSVIRIAVQFNIELIFYGEDGEVEYGGATETENSAIYDIEYIKRIYLEGGYDKVLQQAELTQEEKYFFQFPSSKELNHHPLEIAHWSYFENWDPYRNYLIAKNHCGLQETEKTNSGTFTNFAQNDQSLYSLHAYLMYLKFGFGRANQDACIEIRRGAMDRQQAINLVKMYDGQYPEEFMPQYLEYYNISDKEFQKVLDTFANKDLFVKSDGRWKPTFTIR